MSVSLGAWINGFRFFGTFKPMVFHCVCSVVWFVEVKCGRVVLMKVCISHLKTHLLHLV